MEKKKNGRPKKYTDELIEQYADDLIDWFSQPANFWLKDFAIAKGFSWDSFKEVGTKNEKFILALKKARDMQESKLVKMGFSKKFNPAMAIFALKNVAGWRDKTETDLSKETIQAVEVIIRHSRNEIKD